MSTHPFNPQPEPVADIGLDMPQASPDPEPVETVSTGEISNTVDAPAEEPAADPENVGAKVAKRPPIDLEGDVLTVCRSYASGTIKLPEGKLLTPHAIAKFVEANRGDGQAVSTGAVSDCLRRWDLLGFVNLTEKPIAFDTFVGGNGKGDLDALKQARKEQLAAERAAKREAAKAAEAAAAPAEEPAAEHSGDDAGYAHSDPVADSDTAPAPGF